MKLAFLGLAATIALPSASAQFADGQPLNNVSPGTEFLHVADLDGDGLDDIVGLEDPLALGQAGRAFWHRSLPSGSFAAADDLSPELFSSINAPVDLDGDGDLDLVGSRASSGTLIVLENLGQGQFGTQSTAVSQRLDGQPPAVADFDLDGLDDILVWGPAEWSYHRNLGGLTFAAGVTTGPLNSIAFGTSNIGDVNGDGLADVLTFSRFTQPSENLAWYYQTAAGTFQLSEIVGPTTSSPGPVIAQDVNGDGLLDAVFESSGTTFLHRNLGMGNYQSAVTLLPSLGQRSLAFEDIDADGDVDALASIFVASGSFAVGYFSNDGNGRFTQGPTIDTGANFAEFVAAGDTNGDGRQDLAWTTGQAGALMSSAGSSTGQLDPPVQVDRKIGIVSAGQTVLADLNGDGLQDIAVSDTPNGLRWLPRLASGGFGSTVTYDASAFLSIQNLSAADFDADGIDDLLLSGREAASGDDMFAIIKGSAAGLGPIEQVFAAPRIFVAEPVDVDGDGDVDIVAGADDIFRLENDGAGNFGTAISISALPAVPLLLALSLDLADFNGDGLDDLLLSASGLTLSSQQSVYMSVPSGAFGPPTTLITSSGSAVAATTVDIDGDGDIDVVRILPAVGGTDPTAFWHENQGGQGFGPPLLIGSIGPLASVLSTDGVFGLDVDADGDGDLVYVGSDGSSSQKIRWIETLPGGTFAGFRTLIQDDQELRGLTALDVDGDRDLDLVVSAPDSGTLRLFDNISTQGTIYCTSGATSTGVPAALEITGAPVPAVNGLHLRASQLPTNVFGFFVVADAPGLAPIPGSQGTLCLGGSIGRYSRPGELRNSGPAGTFGLDLDLNAIRTPMGATAGMAGQQWFFQAWFRDANPTATSNLTSGVSVTLR